MQHGDSKPTIKGSMTPKEVSWRHILKLIYRKLTYRKASIFQKLVLSSMLLLLVGYGYLTVFFKYNSYTIEMAGDYLDTSVFSRLPDKTGLHSLSVRTLKVDSFEKYVAVKILNFGHNDLVRRLGVKEVNQQKVMSVGDDLYDMQMTAYLAVKEYTGQPVKYTQKVIVTSISLGGSVPPNLLPLDEIISIDGKKVLDARDIELSQLKYSNRQLEVKRGGKTLKLTSSLYGVKAKRVISLLDSKSYEDFYGTANLELRNIEGRSAGLSLALYNYTTQEKDIIRGRNIAVTGTIDATGRVGFVTGVTQKAVLAVEQKADILFVPKDNYLIQNETEARRVKKYFKSDIEIVAVDTLADVINRLKF